MSEKCGEKCEVFSRVCGYFRPVSNWNKGKKEEFRERKHFKVTGALLAMLAALVLLPALTGCAMVEAVTNSTREKSIAAGRRRRPRRRTARCRGSSAGSAAGRYGTRVCATGRLDKPPRRSSGRRILLFPFQPTPTA